MRDFDGKARLRFLMGLNCAKLGLIRISRCLFKLVRPAKLHVIGSEAE